jgi:hypothetical protein
MDEAYEKIVIISGQPCEGFGFKKQHFFKFHGWEF